MSIINKILTVPQRENAGSRTSNRFNYQQVWAFNRMLELLKQDKNFILLMEFHDDIIILDCSTENEMIDFYQIKTNTTKGRFITTTFITKDGNKYPDEMSIMQKMIDNYSKFSAETKSLHLVSNKFFDYGILRNNDDSTSRTVVKLNELQDTKLQIITSDMCKACSFDSSLCNNSCTDIIYFDVSFQDLINYEETVMGIFVNQLFSMGIESTVSQTKTLFYTILGEIKRINNCETRPYNIQDLRTHKSITSDCFKEWINQLKYESKEGSWDTIQSYLLHDGVASFTVNKIGHNWRKCQIDLMDIEDVTLQDIRNEVKELCRNNKFNNVKDAIYFIYSELINRKDIVAYTQEYIYTIIIRELFL